MSFPLVTLAMPVVGAVGVLVWRLKETMRPLTVRRIVIPPLAMSTGFSMFLYPPTRIPWQWAMGAFLAGLTAFAYPLLKTSTLHVVDGQIYLHRSKAFLWVLLFLLALRLELRHAVGLYVSPLQTGAVFFILAFGMILHWRAHMLGEFSRLSQSLSEPGAT